MLKSLFISLILILPFFVWGKLEVEKKEFLFQPGVIPFCHAPTILETTSSKFLVAFFAGTAEAAEDTAIWVTEGNGTKWSVPKKVTHEENTPCWNPVLAQIHQTGPILLFYKTGSHPSHWKGHVLYSYDMGKTFTDRKDLPNGILGPTKNKPLLLSNNVLLCPSSEEGILDRCFIEVTSDLGKTWEKVGPIVYHEHKHNPIYGIIQPALFQAKNGDIVALFRGKRILKCICMSVSQDQGKTWSETVRTPLKNPDSGFDALRLQDGRVLVVYNNSKRNRNRLAIAVSYDDGKTWADELLLEKEKGCEFSYPAIIQTRDGRVHIVYNYNHQAIKHVILKPN